jgi:hypothetical protein
MRTFSLNSMKPSSTILLTIKILTVIKLELSKPSGFVSRYVVSGLSRCRKLASVEVQEPGNVYSTHKLVIGLIHKTA